MEDVADCELKPQYSVPSSSSANDCEKPPVIVVDGWMGMACASDIVPNKPGDASATPTILVTRT